MRGRAARVALPALAVLMLVAVVAIAATGSTPGGEGETRPPSETLLDTLFTLGVVAVVLGGILLVYGLTQRKAIAREIASGRYRRTGIIPFLVFFVLFTGFSYWRLDSWNPTPPEGEQDLAFPGETPQPTTPATEQVAPYEPSISWIPIAVVVALVVAAVVAYVAAERRARRGRGGDDDLAAQLVAAFDDTLDDLRAEADPRRAIIAAYARFERVLAANGVPRQAADTPAEYLRRALHELALDAAAVERLTALFTRAKFSQHAVDTAMKEEAIDALEHVRDELRDVRDTPAGPLTTPAVGARS